MQRDLVLRARDGDHEAFSRLARDAYDRLLRTARLILRDDERAADAVQDALLSAWIHIRAVRDPDRFEAWLNRLLVHACYGDARRARRRAVIEVHVPAPDLPGPDDSQEVVAMVDLLARGFRRLTTEERAVLVIHHYLGLRDAEAAQVLDIPLGTYKSRLHRASAAMRAAVDADDRAPGAARGSLA